MFNLGPGEIIALVVIGVVLFGRKLPDVGRSLGRTIVEFKKGFHGLEDEVEKAGTPQQKADAVEAPRPPQRVTAPTAAPRFDDNAVPHV